MKILTKAIISNSEMIKNYKACREKTETLGKIFILKNNQPDAVLFSVSEYERVAAFLEYLESLDENDAAKFTRPLPKEGNRRTYSVENLMNDLRQTEKTGAAAI